MLTISLQTSKSGFQRNRQSGSPTANLLSSSKYTGLSMSVAEEVYMRDKKRKVTSAIDQRSPISTDRVWARWKRAIELSTASPVMRTRGFEATAD